MKKILVPCDFSEPAQEAYRFAIDLARKSNGEVVVLKVIDLPITYESTFGVQPYLFDPSMLKKFEEDAQKNFDKMRTIHPSGTSAVRFMVQHGPVTSTIRSFIDSENFDLVVMGTHGASGFKEYFVGSNTEKIVRHSPVPVFSVKKAPDTSSIRNIVYPTALEMDNAELINELKALQSFFQATLHLLFINTPDRFKRESDIHEALDSHARKKGFTNYTVNMRSDYYEQDGIINFAYEINADIIAMATHGRRGLAHMLTGSVAENVVNHVECPIWTYAVRNG